MNNEKINYEHVVIVRNKYQLLFSLRNQINVIAMVYITMTKAIVIRGPEILKSRDLLWFFHRYIPGSCRRISGYPKIQNSSNLNHIKILAVQNIPYTVI